MKKKTNKQQWLKIDLDYYFKLLKKVFLNMYKHFFFIRNHISTKKNFRFDFQNNFIFLLVF